MYIELVSYFLKSNHFFCEVRSLKIYNWLSKFTKMLQNRNKYVVYGHLYLVCLLDFS